MGEYKRLNNMLYDIESRLAALEEKPDKDADDFEMLAQLAQEAGEVRGALLEMAEIDGLDDPYEAFDY